MFLFGGGRRAGLFWLLFRFAVPQESTTRYQRLRGTNRISDFGSPNPDYTSTCGLIRQDIRP